MIDHCYLHIGTEKTGTTSIQHFLAANRDVLRADGFLYPKSLNSPNHMALARYALDDDRVGDLRKVIGVEDAAAVARYRQRIGQGLQQEIAAGPLPRVLILSNEHCHSQVTGDAEVARLAAFLRKFARRITVILYLRPQHELALSKYSTHIKMGGRGVNPFPDTGKGLPPYYDYQSLTQRWAAHFGIENMQVRLFDRRELVDGDLLDDVSAVTGVDRESLATPPKQNESLSPEGLELLRVLNEHVPRFIDGKRNPMRGVLVQQMEEVFPGKGLVVGRRSAETFLAAFEDGNDMVRSQYFPERATLFDPDWDRYPETSPPRPESTDVARAFAVLWASLVKPRHP